MKINSLFLSIKYISLSALILLCQCVTTAKIPVVESAPPNFYQTMKGVRSIGIYVDDIADSKSDDWKNTIHTGIEHALNDFNYFKIVDIKNRSQRLKEMSFAQQMGSELKSLGNELSIQGLLYLNIPESPKHDCQLSTYSKEETYCAEKDKEGKCTKQATRKIIMYEQTLTYTVFVNAKLINTTSGQTIVAANTDSAVLKNSGESSSVSCPSVSDGYASAVQIASVNIAEIISPKVRPFSIPVFTSAVGVNDESNSKLVESYLKRGNSWLDASSPNFDFAKKDWELALNESNYSSANAFWNLAVFYWQSGEISKAEEYFNKALSNGGADFLDSTLENLKLIFRNKRRDVMNKFYEEKKRLQLENS